MRVFVKEVLLLMVLVLVTDGVVVHARTSGGGPERQELYRKALKEAAEAMREIAEAYEALGKIVSSEEGAGEKFMGVGREDDAQISAEILEKFRKEVYPSLFDALALSKRKTVSFKKFKQKFDRAYKALALYKSNIKQITSREEAFDDKGIIKPKKVAVSKPMSMPSVKPVAKLSSLQISKPKPKLPISKKIVPAAKFPTFPKLPAKSKIALPTTKALAAGKKTPVGVSKLPKPAVKFPVRSIPRPPVVIKKAVTGKVEMPKFKSLSAQPPARLPKRPGAIKPVSKPVAAKKPPALPKFPTLPKLPSKLPSAKVTIPKPPMAA